MDFAKLPVNAGLKEVPPLTNPVIISDIHLTAQKPKTIMGFLRFMKTVAPRYAELVILGDLFDFWIGDDAMGEAQAIVSQLKLYTSTGRRVIIMQGNRDVMLGPDFAEACGAELVADPIKIDVMGRPILFSHGDAWCLRDEDYQAFRAMVRNPQWQAAVLQKPVAERIAMAKEARAKSEYDKGEKSLADMDVVERAVAEAAREAGVDMVIHGHTHRPAAHVGAAIERWVLPDWELDDTECAGLSGCITFLEGGRPQIQMF